MVNLLQKPNNTAATYVQAHQVIIPVKRGTNGQVRLYT